MICKLWVLVELISGVVDWPFIAYQLYSIIKKQKKIVYEFNKERNEVEEAIEMKKRDHLNILSEQATDKSELEIDHDFFSLVCFSYLK